MLPAVCKSRPLDHRREITARLWRQEAELCRAVLWGWGLPGQQHHSLPVPGEEAHRGPEASGERLPAAPGRRGGREGVRPVHPAAAPPVHPSAAQRLQHVAGYMIQTRRFLLPRSSPAFCFLLLSAPGDRAPDGKSLLSRSPCWEHPASFRPHPAQRPVRYRPLPRQLPAPAALCPAGPVAAGGWKGLVGGHGRDRPSSQQDTSGCSARGSPNSP